MPLDSPDLDRSLDDHITGGPNPGYDVEIDRQRLDDEAIEEHDFALITESLVRFVKQYGMGRTLRAVAFVAEHPELWKREQG